jgi:hypothetical protein
MKMKGQVRRLECHDRLNKRETADRSAIL